MSGWIKVAKDLSNDPRVLRMASRLGHDDVTLGSRSRLVIVGALVTLWWYADTHIRDDDVLPIGADQIDELVGLKGFCALMPQDWLQVLDSDQVKLVDYLAHNGTVAKKKALSQKRQQRRRSKVTPPSRSRHARVTQTKSPHLPLSDSPPLTPLTKTETVGDAPAREAPRETNGVRYAGTNLTKTAEELLGGLREQWRENVPTVNAVSFDEWLAYLERKGRVLDAIQRTKQAEFLASQGSNEAQAETVDHCMRNDYRRLIPYVDVQRRSREPEKPKSTWRPKPGDDETSEEFRARR